MVNDWGEVRSCLIIAEPTFPPGYYLSVASNYISWKVLKEMMIRA